MAKSFFQISVARDARREPLSIPYSAGAGAWRGSSAGGGVKKMNMLATMMVATRK